VLVNPDDDSVVAIIDWADHGGADPMWDLAVLSLDDTAHVEPLLGGYGANLGRTETEPAHALLHLYRVLRWLGEARWLAARNHPGAAVSLELAASWSPNS
jgi:thiamine kinase-like enzyme